jgi:hypothetical protein
VSRHGIEYQTVKQTALGLLSQGIAPSVQKIREALGTGSNTTIAEHLKVWRDEYASKESHQLPANMPKELIASFEVLWHTAMEHAQNQVTEYKKSLESKQEASLKIQQAAEKAVAELNQKMSETAARLENEATEKQKLYIDLAITKDRLCHSKVIMSP